MRVELIRGAGPSVSILHVVARVPRRYVAARGCHRNVEKKLDFRGADFISLPQPGGGDDMRRTLARGHDDE